MVQKVLFFVIHRKLQSLKKKVISPLQGSVLWSPNASFHHAHKVSFRDIWPVPMGRAKYRWSTSRISPHPEKIDLLLGIPIKMKRCCSESITKRLFWGPTWPTPPETEDHFCKNRAFCAKILFGTEKITLLLWKPTVCWVPRSIKVRVCVRTNQNVLAQRPRKSQGQTARSNFVDLPFSLVISNKNYLVC